MPPIEVLTCEQCRKGFLRALTGEPARYCSKACRNRAYYLAKSTRPHRTKNKRKDRRKDRDRKEYMSAYSRRPEVMERNRLRSQATYVPHPRLRKMVWPVTDVSYPYQGHRWLDMARAQVAADVDPATPWADDRWDEMGEAVIALLEGRDMAEAVREHRRREFIPRHLTVRISDMGASEDERADRFDRIMPTTESAEDEAIAREGVRYRYHHGSNRRHSQSRQQQPSRRRMQDAGINDKRPRSLRSRGLLENGFNSEIEEGTFEFDNFELEPRV